MLENESCIYLLLIFMFYAACLYLVINEVSSPYIFSFFVSNLPCYCPCFSRMSDECDLQHLPESCHLNTFPKMYQKVLFPVDFTRLMT